MYFSHFKKTSIVFIICLLGFYIFFTNYAHLLQLKRNPIQHHHDNFNSISSGIAINNIPLLTKAEKESHQAKQIIDDKPNDGIGNIPSKSSSYDDHDSVSSSLQSIDPVAEYCNFPQTIKQFHDEGQITVNRNDLMLVQSHIVIRHGDRSPLNHAFYNAQNMKPDYCRLDENKEPHHELLHQFIEDIKTEYQAEYLSKDKAMFASPYPNLKYCTGGYLSQQGVVQQLENGVVLRKQYLNLLNVISTPSYRIKKVYAQTTYTQRTLQSLIAFLYGLLPNFELKQTEFNISPGGVFTTIYHICPQLQALEQELMTLRYKYFIDSQKQNETNVKLAKMWNMTEHSGPFIDRILNGFLCKGFDLPCTNGGCVEKNDLEILLEQETATIRLSIEDGVYKNIAFLSMQPFLKRITNSMEEIMKPTSTDHELFVYSGHDTTLKPLLAALDVEEYKWPKMASRLVFELWKDGSEKYYLRVIYNGKDYTNHLKFCNDKKLCSYQDFYEYVNIKLFQHFNATSLDAACSL